MSFVTNVVSHGVYLGKNIGQAISEAGKKHLARVKDLINQARQHLNYLENATQLNMGDFRKHLDDAEMHSNATPPDFASIKNELTEMLKKFERKL